MDDNAETLFNRAVDETAINEILRRNAPAQGNYVTNPDDYAPNVFPHEIDETDQEGNVCGTRRVVSFSGRAFGRIKGTECETTLRFEVSPDPRKARNVDGEVIEKDDIRTRLWAKSVSAYKSMFGSIPKTELEVIDYLTQYPIRAFLYVAPDGKPIVTDISAKKGRRG